MSSAASVLAFFVALLHAWFLILEMFLWTKPQGLKAFRNTAEKAEITRVLAANQGLYNGFLVAGLLVSLVASDPVIVSSFRYFFLSCVIIAGLYGAKSVHRRIFFVQAIPAILALIAFQVSQ